MAPTCPAWASPLARGCMSDHPVFSCPWRGGPSSQLQTGAVGPSSGGTWWDLQTSLHRSLQCVAISHVLTPHPVHWLLQGFYFATLCPVVAPPLQTLSSLGEGRVFMVLALPPSHERSVPQGPRVCPISYLTPHYSYPLWPPGSQLCVLILRTAGPWLCFSRVIPTTNLVLAPPAPRLVLQNAHRLI